MVVPTLTDAKPPSKSARTSPLTAVWRAHEPIKDFLTVLALLVAGVWSYYVFRHQEERRAIESAEARLRERPVANVALRLTVFPPRRGQSVPMLIVRARIQNTGTRPATLELCDGSHATQLSWVALDLHGTDSITVGATFTGQLLGVTREGDGIGIVPRVTIAPSEIVELPYLVPAIDAGLHLLQVAFPVEPADTSREGTRRSSGGCNDTASEGRDNGRIKLDSATTPRWFWTARCYVHVSPPIQRETTWHISDACDAMVPIEAMAGGRASGYVGDRRLPRGAMTDAARLVHSDPEILGGTPVFVGTRVPAQALIDYLEGGHPLDDFLEDFPSVTRAQAVAALELARDALLRATA